MDCSPNFSFSTEQFQVAVYFCSFLQLHVRSEAVLSVVRCHPGYVFDVVDKACVCQDTELADFVRCDQDHRYFYVTVCKREGDGGREGMWYLSQRVESEGVMSEEGKG